MVNYKRHYAFLLFKMDEVLKIMEEDNLLEWDRCKEIMSKALMNVEKRVMNEIKGQKERDG